MKEREYRYFVGDFETTVFEGQTYTEVWSSALVEMYTDKVLIHHSISETFEYLASLKCNVCVYYHNLKFDGSFWMSFLLLDLNFKQAYSEYVSNGLTVGIWDKDRDMKNNTFKYTISNKGQWYTMLIKYKGIYIEFRDSLKLLPFSVKKIGESFGTKHKKLDMEYIGFRYAGCTITDTEKEYIKNDVLVVKEALEIMFNDNHTELTIGSCCLKEYKRIMGDDYKTFFPDMYEIKLDNVHKYKSAGEWIKKSYKGGWCYLVKGKENQIKRNGTTADVNSLYPSVMSSKSGNRYPVGKPKFWDGDYIPDKALQDNAYFFVRIKTRFYIKDNMLPFIQIKNNLIYKGTEMLESSDYYDSKTGKYYTQYEDVNGVHDTRVELTLTMTDYYLMLEHYELVDFEILDGCYFYTQVGIFDDYINHYANIKKTSKGAKRESAKLFLNNLYGKMASSTDSSFKVAYLKEDKSVGFYAVEEHNKKAGYIPIGSAITSYAREFTIRAAQANYHGVNEKGFIYADTDSIHCDVLPSELKGIEVDNVEFCCWKLESCWDEAIFTRQKTYIEHVTHENLKEIDTPYYNIKCAGMPKKCKDLFEKSITNYTIKDDDKYTEEEKEFITTKRELTDFKVGLCVPGKLRPKRIKGGILLIEENYQMRRN